MLTAIRTWWRSLFPRRPVLECATCHASNVQLLKHEQTGKYVCARCIRKRMRLGAQQYVKLARKGRINIKEVK